MKKCPVCNMAVVFGICFSASWAYCGITYDRTELPPEQNAWTYWKQASEGFKYNTHGQDADAAFVRLCDFEKPIPDEPQLALVRKTWIDGNSRYLELISKGIATGRVQFPRSSIGDSISLPFVKFRNAMKTKAASARLAALEGRRSDALLELLEIDRMGRMISDSDCSLVCYMIGGAMRGYGHSAMLEIASDESTPAESITALLNALPAENKSDPALAQAITVDYVDSFRGYIDSVKGFEEDAKPPVDIPFSNLYNRADTVLLAESYYSRAISNAMRGWPERDRDIAADARKLPDFDKLAENALLHSAFGSTNSADDKAFREMVARMAADEPNIYGKLLAGMSIASLDAALKSSASNRTRCNMTRTALAILLFKRSKDYYPMELDDLVHSGILKEVPADLFSEKPLLYSRTSHTIWSVGPDGEDNQGDENKDIILKLLEKSDYSANKELQ